MSEEGKCSKREEGIHCVCWDDGDACCACGDPPAMFFLEDTMDNAAVCATLQTRHPDMQRWFGAFNTRRGWFWPGRFTHMLLDDPADPTNPWQKGSWLEWFKKQQAIEKSLEQDERDADQEEHDAAAEIIDRLGGSSYDTISESD